MATYIDTLPEFGALSLELLVKVHDGDRFAALGLDLRALHGAMFAVGAAELGIAYAHFVEFGEALAGFAPGLLKELEYEIRDRKVAQRTWADLALDDRGLWHQMFELQFDRREGGMDAVGRGDIVRAEIVEVYRENPSVTKIIAIGTLLGVGLLTLTFGSVQIMKQRDAPQCRVAALQSANLDKQTIQRMARLEGRFTENHRAAWQAVEDSYKTSVAACGSALDSFRIDADFPARKFALVLGSQAAAPEKDSP